MLQHAFNGLVNGSFYALLALGLAVIFGMLGVVNFAHAAFYMLGAFGAFVLLQEAGVSFWVALFVVPLVLGAAGMLIERGHPPAGVHDTLRRYADAARLSPRDFALRLLED